MWVWRTIGMTSPWECGGTWRKACPLSLFSTTNSTWSDVGSNPLHGEGPVTCLLIHGKIFYAMKSFSFVFTYVRMLSYMS